MAEDKSLKESTHGLTASLSKPFLQITPSGFFFAWLEGDERHIGVGITRIREDMSKSTIEAELEVIVGDLPMANDPQAILSHVRINLLSLSARESLVRTIQNNCISQELQYLPWRAIINQVVNYTIFELRRGEPVIHLNGNYGKEAPAFLLPPLFVANAANIIYADRSSAKSLFMTAISILLSLPWYDNPLGLPINHDEKHTVLFADWENDADITGWNKECLLRGAGLDGIELPYLHCSRPLADSLDHILERVTEAKADVLIIDSLGMAVGDDLNLTKPAFAFFAALRQIPVTPIIIGHTSKNPESKRKTVYGNAYYENEARSIWEVAKQQSPGSNELTITLFHRKPAPFVPFHNPLGFKFVFEGDKTTIETSDAATDARDKGDTSGPDIVFATIAESDHALGPKEIYELNNGDIPQGSIRQYCYRLKEAGKIKTADGGGYVVT